jgi:molecular chaperone GrpE
MSEMRDDGERPGQARPQEPGMGAPGDAEPSAERTGWPEEPGVAGRTRDGSGWPEEPGGAEDSATKISELEDRWRRALADLDNYRKRTIRELDRERFTERARTTAQWLPILDNLELALQHADADPTTLIQGVQSILGQAREVIAQLGYPRRHDEGARFDPADHEAVSTVSGSGAPEGTVVQVVRPGYGEAENRLRPALVVVAKEQGAPAD